MVVLAVLVVVVSVIAEVLALAAAAVRVCLRLRPSSSSTCVRAGVAHVRIRWKQARVTGQKRRAGLRNAFESANRRIGTFLMPASLRDSASSSPYVFKIASNHSSTSKAYRKHYNGYRRPTDPPTAHIDDSRHGHIR